MSTMSEAVEATLAARDQSDAVARAREEQRESCARLVDRCIREDNADTGNANTRFGNEVRATPLSATPLGDENAALRARVAELERDAQMLSDDDDACHRLLDARIKELEADLTTAANVTAALRATQDELVAALKEETVGHESEAFRKVFPSSPCGCRSCAALAKVQR